MLWKSRMIILIIPFQKEFFFLQCYKSCIHFCIVLSTWPTTPKDSLIRNVPQISPQVAVSSKVAFPNLQSLVSFVFNMVINNNFKTYPGLNPPLTGRVGRRILCDFLLEKVVVIRQESCLCVCVRFLSGTDHSQTTLQAVSAAPHFLLGSAAIFVDLSFAVVLPPTIRGKEQKRGGTDGVGFYCWTSSTWQFCWWPIFGMVKTWPFQRLLVTSNVWWSKGHELNHQSAGSCPSTWVATGHGNQLDVHPPNARDLPKQKRPYQGIINNQWSLNNKALFPGGYVALRGVGPLRFPWNSRSVSNFQWLHFKSSKNAFFLRCYPPWN